MVLHKENLPAQSRLKRRRIDPAPTAELDAAISAGPSEKETVSDDRPVEPAPPLPPPSESSPSSDEDDDDIERENARLAQIRAKTRAARESGETTSKGSSYNHDVLFRRADWRQKGTGKTDNKWGAVANDAQGSAAFKHFMKKHFR